MKPVEGTNYYKRSGHVAVVKTETLGESMNEGSENDPDSCTYSQPASSVVEAACCMG